MSFFRRKPKYSVEELSRMRSRAEMAVMQIQGARQVQSGVVDIACTTQFGTLSFRVILPPSFPETPPDLRLLVQATHPWVNRALQIVAHPGLIKWKPETDLAQMCREIQQEFIRTPPRPLSNPVPVPGMQPHAQAQPQVQSQQFARPQPLQQLAPPGGYPGGSSPLHHSPSPQPQPAVQFHERAAARSVGAGPAPSVGHQHNRSFDAGPPAYGGREEKSPSPAPISHSASQEPEPQKMEKPPVPDSFPKLDAYSTRQLEGMLEDEYKLTEFAETLEAVKMLKSVRDDLYKQVEVAANKNLDHKQNVEAQTQELESMRSELAAKQLHLRDITTRQQQILSAYSSRELIKALEDAMEQCEEDSDSLQRSFMNEDMDASDFAKKYMALRVKYHDRAARKERLAELSGR